MKILSLNQIKKIDQYCIDNEDISSIELMERAAKSCFNWIREHYSHQLRKVSFIILVGNGKNGGDGLALSRMLYLHGANVKIYIVNISNRFSKEFIINKNRIIKYGIELQTINEGEKYPSFKHDKNSKLIDAIFGIGLNRPIRKKYWKSFFHYINNSKFSSVISIDIPSGIFIGKSHDNFEEIIIKATYTLTFQFPKLPFLLQDYENYVGKWYLLNIGWKEEFIKNIHVKKFYINDIDIRYIYKKRKKFSHKGNYGNGLIIGGSYGMIGSILLSAKASFRVGIGKLSVYIPRCGNQIIQTSLPEAIVKTDLQEDLISSIPNSFFTKKYDAIGIGMGMGKHPMTVYALESFLLRVKKNKIPLVIDADAINILSDQSSNKLLDLLKEETILTPHQKEFERLCGIWKNDYQKLDFLKKFSVKHKVFVVLKGAHTVISTPHGELYFNSTGNPGMSTAGSGDVLTGMITGLLSQGYSPKESCIMGVYLHGLSGDLSSKKFSEESIIAMDILNSIGKAYKEIKKNKNE
ncbi:NAD(P)H-hydrate dehydratase [Blattabacterium cuenoti]|uniref:NAD(P)H-hydrate dehydratase n=1 Tax=Blattabacterium cuenoti TaxID=1653831 RepID=UPI00163B892D|nr:NAD(P)H-hydrate dehydratase [Blattabacterium cuenoti]